MSLARLSTLEGADQVDGVPDTFLPLAGNLEVKRFKGVTWPGLTGLAQLTSMLASLESRMRNVAAVSSRLYFFMKFLVDLERRTSRQSGR